MAGNYKQATQLAAVAEENNLNYSIGYMKRYDEGVERGPKIYSMKPSNQETWEN
jgi:predicted dehydrogenase